MRTGAEAFKVDVQPSEQGTVLEVHGELDVSSIRSIRQTIVSVADSDARCVVFDLRAVPYMDSAGLHLLVETRRRLGPGRAVKLAVTPGSLPDRVIRLGRFDAWMAIHDSPEEAISSEVSPGVDENPYAK